ncbi:MAG: bifunctional phosphopantothenoylcysteine decarboxylase/phosphopantothenate--cysteine ligase CoaBC, partial [Flavobacteriales bacterium]|nr:bifunctional phosphopantothenoylcysteine decarboxylase/phosphopantothenate--cysteine ligase CoaBC [Flavobacteriales bacterium]
MFQHPSTTKNLMQLADFGHHLIPPEEGELASGLIGEGRMAEPDNIIEFINEQLRKSLPLKGKKVMVTAGPTYEAIDPVRFIGNHSSGKMGFSIANEAAKHGADVTLICGPTNLDIVDDGIARIDIVSAQDLYEACVDSYKEQDIIIMAAAVADFTPEVKHTQKIKKQKDPKTSIALKSTSDVLKKIGELKSESQILVGFALETNDEEAHAKKKLKNKNLDFIVLNSLNDAGAGFQHFTNKISIIDRDNNVTSFKLKHKLEVAKDIIKKVISLI